MAKLSGFVEKHKDGTFWAVVDMPSNEPQDVEHPSTFGYTEDVGPFDTEAEAHSLLDTGTMSSRGPKKLNQPKGYPSNFDEFRKHEAYGHGGVRIYKISPQQAASIHKELKLPYELQKLREGHEYFYLNQNHGEHHVIFVFPKTA